MRPHDDSLFLEHALNILNGNWLGDYFNKTLIKGVGYPLFIVVSAIFGIPLIALQHLFYAAICFLVVVAVQPKVKNPVALFCGFAFLLFNPVTYDYPLMSQLMLEGFAICLCLWVFASIIGLVNYQRSSFSIVLLWSLSLAVS